MSDKPTQPTVILHPKLQKSVDRLMNLPGLTRDTLRRIRRDLHQEPSKPEQLSLEIKSDV